MLEVPRIRDLTKAAFAERFFAPGLPVVAEGGFADSHAARNWTPEYVARVAGSSEVDVRSEPDADGYFGYWREPVRMTLAAYVSELLAPAAPLTYLNQLPLERLPGLLADWSPPPLMFPDRPSSAYVWMGPAGTRTPLHFDRDENFYAQIYGKKSFVLIPPEDYPYVYPNLADPAARHRSLVRCRDVDHVKFPEFAKARKVLVELEPGDLLFLPAWWWHEVTSLEPAISVNTWQSPRFERCLGPAAVRMTMEHPLLCTIEDIRAEFDCSGLTDLATYVERLVDAKLHAAAACAAGMLLSASLLEHASKHHVPLPPMEAMAQVDPEGLMTIIRSIAESKGWDGEVESAIVGWYVELFGVFAEAATTLDHDGTGPADLGQRALEICAFVRREAPAG